MPDEALFHKNSSFGLEQTIETEKNWCIWGIFDRFISTHFGCFSFGPQPIQSPDIWSPTIGPQEQTVPAHLVPIDKWSPRQLVPLDNWSPKIWSPWTNGPQDNWSPWTNSPQTFGPHGQMVPKAIGPHGQLVPKID